MTDIVTRARAYLVQSRDACAYVEDCVGAEARDYIMELAAEVERLRVENERLGYGWRKLSLFADQSQQALGDLLQSAENYYATAREVLDAK